MTIHRSYSWLHNWWTRRQGWRRGSYQTVESSTKYELHRHSYLAAVYRLHVAVKVLLRPKRTRHPSTWAHSRTGTGSDCDFKGLVSTCPRSTNLFSLYRYVSIEECLVEFSELISLLIPAWTLLNSFSGKNTVVCVMPKSYRFSLFLSNLSG
jgi:hypothetical protein